MTPKELANLLDGSDLKKDFSKLIAIAEDHNLVISFCTDNELLELKGCLESDYDIFRSETLVLFDFDDEYCLFDKTALGVKDDGDDYLYAAHEGAEKGNFIKVTHHPSEFPGAVWHVSPDFEHEGFNIFNGAQLYCRGAVFSFNAIN